MDQQELIVRGVVALERIANALEALLPAPIAADDTTADDACQHPMATRIDFGVTNGVEDWQCGQCGYRTVPAKAEAES